MNFLRGPQTKREVIGDAVTLATLCAGEWEREVKGGNGGKGAAAGGEGNAGGDVPL